MGEVDRPSVRRTVQGNVNSVLSPHEPYSIKIWPPKRAPAFQPGDEVFVKLHSEMDTGRAVIVEPLIQDPEHQFSGRVKLRYHHDQTYCHVRPNRIAKVETKGTMLICFKTESYRKLCRSQLEKQDVAIDIGCSYGKATHVMSQHCDNVLGLDISREAIVSCRRDYPHVRFEVMDCLEYPEQIATVSTGVNKVFLDIGGNRERNALIRLISFVQQNIKPDVIVVKSEALVRSAEEHTRRCQVNPDDDNIPASEKWWRQLQEETVAKINSKLEQRVGETGLRFPLYALKYPRKYLSNGVEICRFHNYSACPTHENRPCDRDHEHCHYCLQPGHSSQQCTAKDPVDLGTTKVSLTEAVSASDDKHQSS